MASSGKRAIIGICGPARAGKSLAASMLVVQYGFSECTFAGPIRSFVASLMGLPGGLEELEGLKEQPHHVFGGCTPRYAMQTLGTEWGRQMISETLWVDACMARVDGCASHVVISDVRFANEARAIRERGGVIVRIVRPGMIIPESAHASEAGLPPDMVDLLIENSGDAASLQERLKECVSTLVHG